MGDGSSIIQHSGSWRVMNGSAPHLEMRCQCDGECGEHGPCRLNLCDQDNGYGWGCRRWPTILGIVYLNGDTKDSRPENLKVICCRCRIRALARSDDARQDDGASAELSAVPS